MLLAVRPRPIISGYIGRLVSSSLHLAPIEAATAPPAALGESRLTNANVLVAAWIGTVLAGGLFPLIVAAVMWATSGFPLSPQLPLLFVLPVAGCYAAGIVGAGVLVVMLLVCWISGLPARRADVAATMGGWTGLIATCGLLLDAESELMPVAGTITLAVVLGQAGAGWAAAKAIAAHRRLSEQGPGARPDSGFSLRELFGLTTAFSLVACGIAALQPGGKLLIAMGLCAAFQLATIAATTIARAWRPAAGA